MTVGTIALIISGLSLLVAGTSLGWNVYRDVILKPRLRIFFAVSGIASPRGQLGTFISISAVNHGPGFITCSKITTKSTSILKWILRRRKYAIILHDWTNPLSGKLPHRLDVGETLTLLLPYERGCFLKEPVTHVGICDTFGKIHWASRSSVVKVQEQYAQKFATAGTAGPARVA